jgi:hypothetical protein
MIFCLAVNTVSICVYCFQHGDDADYAWDIVHTTFFRACRLFWAGPLLIWGGGGGIFGLCALVFAFDGLFDVSTAYLLPCLVLHTWAAAWSGLAWLRPLGLVSCAFIIYQFGAYLRIPGKSFRPWRIESCLS